MCQYNFSDLVLLVGTNPLPNFVTAKYFSKINSNLKKIWLVYSKDTQYQRGTRKFADHIKNAITKEPGIKPVDINLVSLRNVSLAERITSDVREKLLHKLSSDTSGTGAHLNYTGGTKAMAVHVYREIQLKLKGRCSFSYLDARDYTLKDDEEGPITADMRELVDISLLSLMKLHGCEKKESKTGSPHWPWILDEFERIIENGGFDAYLDWASGFLRKVYYNKKGFISQKNKFLKHNRLGKDGSGGEKLREEYRSRTPEIVRNLIQLLPPEHSLLDDSGQLWVPGENDSNSTFTSRLALSVREFLSGKWLEAYVEKVLKDNIQLDNNLKSKTIPLDSNWEIYNQESKKPFELDVIVINGYQVCGISCTTDRKEAKCKEKGFEVLHRINQIGGDEARAVLITCLSDESVETVVEDLRTVSGSTEKKFLVVGRTSLKKDLLWKELSEHIWRRR